MTSPLPPYPSVLNFLPRGIRVARDQPQPGSFHVITTSVKSAWVQGWCDVRWKRVKDLIRSVVTWSVFVRVNKMVYSSDL